MKSITEIFKNGKELLSRYLDIEPAGGLLVRQRWGCETGQRLCLEVGLKKNMERLYILTVVMARCRTHREPEGLRSYTELRFLPGEQPVRDRLMELAHEEMETFRRRKNDRISTMLDVRCTTTFDPSGFSSLVTDLGHSGAFVVSLDPPEAGTPVRLQFAVPGFADRQVAEGSVAWTRGDDGMLPGMGVCFDLSNPTEKRHFMHLYRLERRRSQELA